MFLCVSKNSNFLWKIVQDVNKKVPGLELKRSGNGGGAFQPFHKEERGAKTSESLSKAPSSTSVAAASSSSAEPAAEKSLNEGHRKQRRCWSQDLHKRFLHALQQLGGADSEYLYIVCSDCYVFEMLL